MPTGSEDVRFLGAGVFRKCRFRDLRTEFDPGCVKTLCCGYDSPVIRWGN
jgi:hypothetical protein